MPKETRALTNATHRSTDALSFERNLLLESFKTLLEARVADLQSFDDFVLGIELSPQVAIF